MFPSFFAPSLGARKEQKKVLCMQFSVFDFYFLIWCLLIPIEKIYMTRGEREKAQQQILNTHKTATIEDRFSCNRTSMCALCTTREGERARAFLCTRSNIFNSRKLNSVHYIFMLLAATNSLLPALQFSPKLQQVAFDVHSHTFISFPFSAELFQCAMRNMKMFFFLF